MSKREYSPNPPNIRAYTRMKPSPSPMSTVRFWLLTFGLVVVWSIVYASAATLDAPTPLPSTNSLAPAVQEQTDTTNCKSLCGQCGCLGFYCGEECLCECNKENSDTECIGTMQSHARQLRIPFELLIQGPTTNRLVRSALQFEQNEDRKQTAPERNRRSTVVIYKPAPQNSLVSPAQTKVEGKKRSPKNSIVEAQPRKLEGKKPIETAGSRQKRSANQMEWFSDFANNLVRPAPLIRPKKEEEEGPAKVSAAPLQPRHKSEMDRSWFNDNSNTLVRPAPLFRRAHHGGADRDHSQESPGIKVEGIPQMVKDTIRNMQEGAFVNDFTDAFRFRNNEGVLDVFRPNVQKTDIFTPIVRDNLQEVIEKVRNDIFSGLAVPPAMEPPTPVTQKSPQFEVPWFRPVRFLRRVHEAIKDGKAQGQ